ncbi:hypothetical protein COL5a_007230 [Colletotrichum fioriniae]|nr:hypothetical protein COL5a_007230 [Colletotrichum fioriniae]
MGHILKFAEETVKNQKDRLEKRLERLQNPQSSQTSKPEQHNPAADENAPIDHNSFVRTSNKFRKFQERLQMIHGDFAKARPISDHWLNREQDRQAEQPRWTFSDESRYRPILNKLFVTNRRAIQDLDHNLKEMSMLAESITKELEYVSSGLESISNEESRQNNKDVKLFTYITAVFLPLGFATGVFSMSGPPDGLTVGYMFAVFIGLFIVGASIFLSLTKKFEELVGLSGREAWKNAIASFWPRQEGSPGGKPTRRKSTDSRQNVADEFSWRGVLRFFRSNEKEVGGALEAGKVRPDASLVGGTAPSGSA